MQNPDDLSRFNDVKDKTLRTSNRGAIMANMFEEYYEDMQTHSYSYKDFLSAIDLYTSDFTKAEYAEAKQEMQSHLLKRGYRYGC